MGPASNGRGTQRALVLTIAALGAIGVVVGIRRLRAPTQSDDAMQEDASYGVGAARAHRADWRQFVASTRRRLDDALGARDAPSNRPAEDLLDDVETAVAVANAWGDVDAVRAFADSLARIDPTSTWQTPEDRRGGALLTIRLLVLPRRTYAVLRAGDRPWGLWSRAEDLGPTAPIEAAARAATRGVSPDESRLGTVLIEPLRIPKGYGSFVIVANGSLATVRYEGLLPFVPPTPVPLTTPLVPTARPAKPR